MFDHLLELSLLDNSNKKSNLGFGEEIMHVVLIEVNFMQLIWSSGGHINVQCNTGLTPI